MASSLAELCEQVKSLLPEDLRDDRWYLPTAAGLVASGKPTELGNLYQYILDTEFPNLTAAQERRLASRFSDLLMKEWTLVGIPTVLMAVSALAKVERYVSAENTGLDEKRKNIDFEKDITERGTKLIELLYKQNLQSIFDTWGSYREEFVWLEKSVIYGLFLADQSVLSKEETLLVTLPGIMCQGWPGPAMWHLRGLRRIGLSVEDVEKVQQAVEAVAVWAGKSVEGWPRVTDIKDEI
ncbi:uncharacterized protein PADG_00440 [Paracoccidioides brasiliensis Pb18]|uniref:Carboxymuconolactone decarboxylase-like domain-containing protein n=2 Tax=Paracoccidioides brasiliensis TaxID=121759 RepID=C1G0Q0_PARBD|nr:uncharacterized protein PADG_00440 [Paracoccidioides brasiliensis Pb18]EEH44151.2 hypothetical protein PADG_00440 [Paracoccidioides brasiliensis Pb18]ODH12834.1 hypothetical protein ACO22_07867 [Paracoccidioides brasiliensis]